MSNPPAGYSLDQSASSDVPSGYISDDSSAPTTAPAPPSGYQPDQSWHQLAGAEVQRRGLSPLTDSSEMIAVYDAHRKAFGTPAEQAMPEYGQQLVGKQQQLQQQQNASHGQLASTLLEALHPAAQVQAGLENLLAPAVGLVSDAGAANMRQHAQTLEDVRGNTDSLGGIVGGIAGNVPVMANPIIAGAVAGGETYHQIEDQNAAGANISGANEALDVTGQAVLAGVMSKLLGDNASGGVAKTIEQKLAPLVPSFIAKYGARAAMGALIQAGQGMASNVITAGSVDPNQGLTEGIGRNAMIGAGTEVGLGALHDLTANKTPLPTETPAQSTPAAPPTEAIQPAVTQAETSAQRPPKSAEDVIAENNSIGDRIMALHDQLQAAEDANRQKRESVYRAAGLQSDESVSEPQQETAKPQTFTSRDMVNYINLHSEDADIEGARQLLGNKNYVKQDVPIDQLDTRGSTALKQGTIQEYAAKSADTAPAVVADETGQIIDGNRRLEAARLRGDKTVSAYVPDTFGQAPEMAKTETQPRSLIGSLMSDESGGTQALHTFAERAVIPEAKSTLKAARESYGALNRLIGTGAGDDAGAEGVKNDVRKMQGNMDLDRAKAEEALRPSREAAKEYNQHQTVQWMEALEAGQPSPDPATQKAMDVQRQFTQDIKAEADKVGINTSKWSEDWAGRLAKWDDREPGTGKGGSIAGSQSFLKGRKLDTFGDFVKAVEATGGKLAYDNPVDMMVAKNLEVQRSVEARKLLYSKEDQGVVKWIGEGEKWPDGHQPLEDKLGQQKRPLIAPKEILARLGQTDGMFNADDLFKKYEDNGVIRPLRPGDHMPEGYNYTGREKAGRYAAAGGVTPVFNDLIAPGAGKTLPLWDKVVAFKRAANTMRLAFSAWHLATTTIRNAGLQTGLALDNAFHGEFGEAGRNLSRANPFSAASFGKDILEAAKQSGQGHALDPLVQAAADAGAKLRGRSFLEPDALDKAERAFKESDPISGTVRGLQAVANYTTKQIMERFVPSIKTSYLGALADTYIKRGYTGDALAEVMRKGSQTADNVLGDVVRSNQFQHRVIQDVGDLVMLAPKFVEGDIRSMGAAGRDVIKGMVSLAKGHKPTVTPAMYSYMGHVLTQATMGAAIQMAYTLATTGKAQFPTSFKDFFMPKTGRKDQNGNDERISFPTGLSVITSLATEGPAKTLLNRVDPLLRSVYNIATNSDYRNVQIHDPGLSMKSIGQSAKYLGKSMIPFSAQGLVEPPTGNPNTPDLKLLGAVGVRRASTKNSLSKAEQTFNEIQGQDLPARTPEEAARHDLRTQFVTRLRNGDADARGDMREARLNGTLTLSDVQRINELAKAPQGIVGRIKESSMSPDQLMKVWSDMTDDEKFESRSLMRRKIAESKAITSDERRTYLDQIRNESE